ncbi:uncharacterized protein TNIN_443922 [Trichonephila inaurata madagascariensis]|uniref:Uncharacterized protein n=2 Tax=Trichonephila inaurata madagascariensis TaxID=2747483 RepID=A0A8X6JR28_9ARAC|nr:uncharacterized protein TNIN_443922 [Trichonephila inaurata madagascariensis]
MALNKFPVLSLRQLALVKIAVAICNDKDIRDVVHEYGNASFAFLSKETHMFLRKPPFPMSEEVNQLRINECQVKPLMRSKQPVDEAAVFIQPESSTSVRLRVPMDVLPTKKWEDLVESKISATSLPPPLQTKLFTVVRILTFEIDNWVKDHSGFFPFCSEFQGSLQWKSRGKIDRKKTAEVLVSNEALQRPYRYKLACLYDMDSESHSLWDTMSSSEKKKLWTKNKQLPYWFVNDFLHSETPPEADKEQTPLFHRKTFSEFFLSRKLKYLSNSIFWKTMDFEDLLLCLSETDASTREDVFKNCALHLLEYFLDWPLQNEFVDVADLLWSYLSEHNFRELLELILGRMMVGWMDYDYASLLRDFWSHSPAHYREFIKQDSIYESLVLAMNHDSIEPFPNERLLANYDKEYLAYKFQGVKYCMFKSLSTSDSEMGWQNDTQVEFYKGCKRAHAILFSNVEKRKYNELEQNE